MRARALATAVVVAAMAAAAEEMARDPGAGKRPPNEQAPAAQAPARVYKITIVQGASRAEVERLTAGAPAARVQSTRSSRSGPQFTSVQVVAGKPASVELGRIVQKVDSVNGYGGYDGRGDGSGDVTGVAMGDRRLTRRMTVTARPRGANVEVEIEATMAREGRDHAANAQVQNVATTLLVKEGKWVEVASGSTPEGSDPVKRQSTSARLEESGLLLRVDGVRQ